MSLFSDKLRAAIEECGVPVAELAEHSGLSVSMLYKLQSGARCLDSLESFERLLDAMFCPIPLRQELLMEYKIERIGMSRYACFQELKGLIHDIGLLSPNIRELSAPDTLNLPGTINGSRNVNAAIATIVNREALRDGGFINIMIPLSHGYSLECVSQALSGCVQGFRGVCHLFCLKASGSDDALLSNMIAIRCMLPRMLNLDRYDIRYGYVPEPDSIITPFPYFIITSECVLLMNGSISDAVFLKDPEICFNYNRSFGYMASNFKPVMRTGKGNILDFFGMHQSIVDDMRKRPVPVTMASQPCILPCLPHSSISNYLPKDALADPEVMTGLEDFFRRSESTGYITFFTMEGLHFLLETGQIMEMVGPDIPRFSKNDVLDSLEELIRRAKHGNVVPYLFKENDFGVSRLSLGLYGDTLFIGCEIPSRQEVFTDVTENTLSRVLKDYAEKALLLGDVVSPEETIRVLESEIWRFRREAS